MSREAYWRGELAEIILHAWSAEGSPAYYYPVRNYDEAIPVLRSVKGKDLDPAYFGPAVLARLRNADGSHPFRPPDGTTLTVAEINRRFTPADVQALYPILVTDDSRILGAVLPDVAEGDEVGKDDAGVARLPTTQTA